jgi:hypothetical protein
MARNTPEETPWLQAMLWWQSYRKRHAEELAKLRRWLIGTKAPQTHFLTRWLFLRGLGIIYLIAFVSFYAQIDGLVSSEGILPAADYLTAVDNAYDDLAERTGRGGIVAQRLWRYPTLCWLNSTDAFLYYLAHAGIVAALLLIVGVAPIFSLVILWASYLSISTVGQTFLGYQWDTLILEVGFLAIFLAPACLLPRISRETRPPIVVIWLYRLLLIRVMFASGLAKLTSWDETWWGLTALNFHYETQPIPNLAAYYVHQLPGWFHSLSVAAMFGCQLLLILFVFCPRRVRLLPFWGTIFLQTLIILTGNYCFFNLLTILICILLLDDQAIRAVWRGPLLPDLVAGRARPVWTQFVRVLCLLALVAVSIPVGWWQMKTRALGLSLDSPPQTCTKCQSQIEAPQSGASKIVRLARPFRTINSYGLFASMTTTRPEIIIEGSDDKITWHAYEFEWKPGELSARPRQVAPHQPRLDWQMWFEALHLNRNRYPKEWFKRFIGQLQKGNPKVLAMLRTNPFPDGPPRYLKLSLYNYTFTDKATRAETGDYWERTFIRPIELEPKRRR